MDCEAILLKLRSVEGSRHTFNPPCTDAHIRAVEDSLGQMPSWLRGMLKCFSGAELFLFQGPCDTIFGLSLPADEGFWSVDRYTPVWREHRPGEKEWAIGITNYGGLYVAGSDNSVREWDTSEARWLGSWASPEEWIEHVIAEGTVVIAEAKQDEEAERARRK
ncbi:MAG TPA: SMI1/KNR4 family protein [Tepidisphaeraceae bacterium]|nr:SMI1/KNR4 family protein [Tepidisphaeraceae bacterium]